MPTSAKLRLIADLMDDGGAFEVRTNGDLERAWCSPDTMRPADFIADRWDVRRKVAEWKLPEPPEGKQWHRTDWTKDMLPEGWRPLLAGEVIQEVDECCHKSPNSHFGACYSFIWLTPESTEDKNKFAPPIEFRFRTRRPLPQPDTLPLEERVTLLEKQMRELNPGLT